MKTFLKPLTPSEEREYLRRLREGERSARDVLIERNMRLVAHVVKKYQGTDYDTEDLLSVGTIGLIKAESVVLSGSEITVDKDRELAQHGIVAYQLKKEVRGRSVHLELVALRRIAGYGNIVGKEIAIGHGAFKIVGSRHLYITTYTECHPSLTVDQQESGRTRVLEMELPGVIEHTYQLTVGGIPAPQENNTVRDIVRSLSATPLCRFGRLGIGSGSMERQQ